MAETEHIDVAEVSSGQGGTGRPGTTVRLPVVELLTGRGFVTGKSGSGKSNTASVVAEQLLANGFGLLIVDIDGEYYGLKEEYEILHVGGDEECDVQVTPDHAEKLATLALEQNVPIILDVSSFLDEDEAEELLTAVARHLFAKAKKRKQPFLVLVEEVHEYIPENGAVGECGKMLIKIGKRGRKHGLGICGISQRPADVKKDFITQCDWLVWHRLTWDNDTKVVRRVLDGKYAEAVENLADGEAFLKTDWSGTVRRVQFYRKQTFDAGATPGLDDFERPELKSVSDDLVSELSAISEEQQRRENRIAELRDELDRKNSRIAELEAELQDARDLSRMADQFVEALLAEVEGAAPGRTEVERQRDGPRAATNGAADDAREHGSEDRSTPDGGGDEAADAGMAFEAFDAFDEDGDGEAASTSDGDAAGGEATDDGMAAAFSAFEDLGSDATESEPAGAGEDDAADRAGTISPDVDRIVSREGDSESWAAERARVADPDKPGFVRAVTADLGDLDERARRMLTHYRDEGPATPIGAHLEAGGDGDRTRAYAHNRALRLAGLVEHVGRGRYVARVEDELTDRAGVSLEPEVLDRYADYAVERAAGGA